MDALFFNSVSARLPRRLHADRKRYLKAARDGKRRSALLRRVPAIPQRRSLRRIGLFTNLADVLPKRYKILRPFTVFFPRGNRARGLAELDRAMTRGRFVPTETAYSLLQIHYLFEQNYHEALKNVQWLRQRYPDNSLFHLYEARPTALGRVATQPHLPGDSRALERGIPATPSRWRAGALRALAVEIHRNLHSVATPYSSVLEAQSAPPGDTEYRAL